MWEHIQAAMLFSQWDNAIQVQVKNEEGEMVWELISVLEEKGFELVTVLYSQQQEVSIGVFKRRVR